MGAQTVSTRKDREAAEPAQWASGAADDVSPGGVHCTSWSPNAARPAQIAAMLAVSPRTTTGVLPVMTAFKAKTAALRNQKDAGGLRRTGDGLGATYADQRFIMTGILTAAPDPEVPENVSVTLGGEPGRPTTPRTPPAFVYVPAAVIGNSNGNGPAGIGWPFTAWVICISEFGRKPVACTSLAQR